MLFLFRDRSEVSEIYCHPCWRLSCLFVLLVISPASLAQRHRVNWSNADSCWAICWPTRNEPRLPPSAQNDNRAQLINGPRIGRPNVPLSRTQSNWSCRSLAYYYRASSRRPTFAIHCSFAAFCVFWFENNACSTNCSKLFSNLGQGKSGDRCRSNEHNQRTINAQSGHKYNLSRNRRVCATKSTQSDFFLFAAFWLEHFFPFFSLFDVRYSFCLSTHKCGRQT